MWQLWHDRHTFFWLPVFVEMNRLRQDFRGPHSEDEGEGRQDVDVKHKVEGDDDGDVDDLVKCVKFGLVLASQQLKNH